MRACDRADAIGRDSCLPRAAVFVGGLQRSGTTTFASRLLSLSSNFSGLSVPELAGYEPPADLIDVITGTRMSLATFHRTVVTGGAEGKLLQTVIPYRNSAHDLRCFSWTSLFRQPSELSHLVSPRHRDQLWAEWRQRWPPGLVFIDKTPENVLMAPFLQAEFGRGATAFVFVLRHPVSWALAFYKWGCASCGGDSKRETEVDCIDRLVHSWLVVHERLHSRVIPALKNAVSVRIEELQSQAALRQQVVSLLGPAVGALLHADGPQASDAASHRSLLQRSHFYAYCYLRGYGPAAQRLARNSRIDANCSSLLHVGRRSLVRQARLSRVWNVSSRQFHALGYRLDLESLSGSCCSHRPSLWMAGGPPAVTPAVTPAETRPAGDAPSLRPANRVVGWEAKRRVLVVGWSQGYTRATGMQQRAVQVLVALHLLGYELHALSDEPCRGSALGITCHTGSQMQVRVAAFLSWAFNGQRAAPDLLLLPFTRLTMEVTRPLGANDPVKAQRNATVDLSKIRTYEVLTALDALLAQFPHARVITMTDDVHHERAQLILAQLGILGPHHGPLLKNAGELEANTYRMSDLVLTVSDEDAWAIWRMLGGEVNVATLPFVAPRVAGSDEVPPMLARERGYMLYVGHCHPVARQSVSWLLNAVLPRLIELAEGPLRSLLKLVIVGSGWEALQGQPPIAGWVRRGVVRIAGVLSDADLKKEYSRALLFISPSAQATGISTKVFAAMALGLPVLTTPMGLHGLALGKLGLAPPTLEGGHLLCCVSSRAGGAAMPESDSAPRLCSEAGLIQTPPLPGNSSAGVHPSGAALVANSPDSFARAAALAMTDSAVWRAVSTGGLHHQRMLTASYQASSLASAFRAALRFEPLAQTACVLFAEASDAPAVGRALEAMALVDVAVHVVVCPSWAESSRDPKESSRDPTESSRDHAESRASRVGVFSYSGSCMEQWLAVQASEPTPPIAFTLVVGPGLSDLARILMLPSSALATPAAAGRAASLVHRRLKCLRLKHADALGAPCSEGAGPGCAWWEAALTSRRCTLGGCHCECVGGQPLPAFPSMTMLSALDELRRLTPVPVILLSAALPPSTRLARMRRQVEVGDEESREESREAWRVLVEMARHYEAALTRHAALLLASTEADASHWRRVALSTQSGATRVEAWPHLPALGPNEQPVQQLRQLLRDVLSSAPAAEPPAAAGAGTRRDSRRDPPLRPGRPFANDSARRFAMQPVGALTALAESRLFGADGDRADFRGLNGTVYCMLSLAGLAVNARYMDVRLHGLPSRDRFVEASAMLSVFLTIRVDRALTVRLAYEASRPQAATLLFKNGTSAALSPGLLSLSEDVSLELREKGDGLFALTVSYGLWRVACECINFPYPKLQAAARGSSLYRLQLYIRTTEGVESLRSLKVAPHGLIGQTFDGDGIAVDGAMDEFRELRSDASHRATLATTSMAEGSIEGTALDYAVSTKDPFSTAFAFSRFHAEQAPPRNLSLLTGVKRRRMEHDPPCVRWWCRLYSLE